jgi:hypothetical protein
MPETTTETPTPTLASAVARILQLAATAAMQGRTDRDLLQALDAIGSTLFAASHEYHGHDDPTEGEAGAYGEDVPY